MNNPNIKNILDQMILRIRDDSFFLANVLTQYEAMHGITDQQLADHLECTYDDILKLFLCRMPNDEAPQFQRDIARIADYAHCNVDKLVNIYRETVAIRALRNKSEDVSNGLLMAARDRQKGKKDPEVNSKSATKEERKK